MTQKVLFLSESSYNIFPHLGDFCGLSRFMRSKKNVRTTVDPSRHHKRMLVFTIFFCCSGSSCRRIGCLVCESKVSREGMRRAGNPCLGGTVVAGSRRSVRQSRGGTGFSRWQAPRCLVHGLLAPFRPLASVQFKAGNPFFTVSRALTESIATAS
jgi:hypothetical protein